MWMLLVVVILILLYYIFRKQYSYWKKHGIPCPTPLPIVGNIGLNIIGKVSVGEIVTDIYRKYEGYSFVGFYRVGTPCLIIRDIDFIKNITVKDFKSFEDNEIYFDKDVDPLVARHPFALKGEEWKKSRSQLTPFFTSGKMKAIFPLIEDICKRMVKYVSDQTESPTVIEVRELSKMFTMENVAACAFGIEARCFDGLGSEFEDLARNFIPSTNIKMILLTIVPALMNFMSVKFLSKDAEDKIQNLIKAALKYREENNIKRNDFLDFINQLSKTLPDFTDIDAAAHASSFLSDGNETSSQAMSFVLFELALCSEAQSKLREEINSVFENNNKQFSYETVQSMVYLDACVNESMRKNPAVFFISKVCTKRYTYTSTNPDYKTMSVTVDPGTPIILPIQGLQLDNRHFQQPEKFVPERFLNKGDIIKYTYLPFGEGPRACLGQRFAVMQIKLGIIYLIKHFEIKLNERTQLPLSYDPWYFLSVAKDGLWLNFYKI